MSRNAYTTGLIGLIFGSSLLFVLVALLQSTPVTSISYISTGTTIFYAGLLVVHMRGWRYTAEVLVGSLVVATVLSASPEYMAQNLHISILMPGIIAAALLSPAWSFSAFAATLIGSILSVGLQRGFAPEALGPTVRFENLLILVMAAVGVSVASSLTRNLQRQATESARQAQDERDQVEVKSRELIEANHQMNDQIAQQRQLLDLVATLETPAVQLADGVLFVPLVGHVDARRAQALTARLLKDVNAQRARLVILDISAVAVMDTGVAQALLNTAKALRLLGCGVSLSGISAGVALTLTDLGIDLDEVQTVRSPQEALTLFLSTVVASNGKVRVA